jgi:hypothetical protein
MWYEGYAPTNTSGLIDLSNTSGSISIACMQWYLNNTSLPIISVNNFSGTLTLLDCGFNQVPRTEVKMNGDGSGATIFSAYNYFGGGDTTGCTADSIWEDSTFPNAESALLGCLACQGTQLDNVVNKIHNQIPDTNFVLNAVAQLRAVRTDPPNDMVPGVTDVKFFRVGARVAEGNISVHFISTNTSGISPVANSASKLKVFPDPAYKNFTVELPSQKFDLTVYDFTGRKILFQKNIFGKTEINCANFPAGVYFVQVRNERQKNIIGKVVLMKN